MDRRYAFLFSHEEPLFLSSPSGPIFFSALVVAEALGSTGTAQLIDLNANNGNVYTPVYAIYEQGNIARVALFNYVTDPSGGSTYTASISIGGGQSGQGNGTPGSVKVKYLSAASVSQKQNITWANQVRTSLLLHSSDSHCSRPSETLSNPTVAYKAH